MADMLRQGGWGAWLALWAGVLGSMAGVAAVLWAGKRPAWFKLAAACLGLGILAAGLGIGGQLHGQRRIDYALVTAENAVDAELMLKGGYREAQEAARLGSFASLVPLLLGALAAWLAARRGEPSERVSQALALAGLCALACAGAWVMAHRELPAGEYEFDENDGAGWMLASAIEEAKRSPQPGCQLLEAALGQYWGAADKAEWPRVMRTPIPLSLSRWRNEADRCARRIIDDEEDPTRARTLLISPLLQDGELRARAQVVVQQLDRAAESLGGRRPKEPLAGMPSVVGLLDPELVRKVMHANRGQIRYCYESRLAAQPMLAGKVTVKFVISPTGSVSTVSIESSTVRSAALDQCVAGRVRTWMFPKPKGGGVAIVVVPIDFGRR